MTDSPLAAARELTPLIQAHRAETDEHRTIPGPIVEALKESRLARMALTSENHGLETPVVDALQVLETLAAAEASVSWVVWNNSLPCWFCRGLEAQPRSEIFADPVWWYANSTRPQGRARVSDNGFVVDGRWSLVSGCEHAEWMQLLCIVIDETGTPVMLDAQTPALRFVYLHREQLQIIDTWYVGGLRGTGSHDVVASDAFVPLNYSITPDQTSTLNNAFGRVPIVAIITAGLAAQNLGVAVRCLESVKELGITKVSPGPVPDIRDRTVSQLGIAEHSAAIEAVRSHLHRCVGEMWDRAVSGAEIDDTARGRVYSAAYLAIKHSQETVDAMYRIGGTTAIYNDSPLERAHRDIHVMGRQISSQTIWPEDAGRVMFGLPPAQPLYSI